ncbi:hypothetical protein ABW19_dt0208028 [Dactylella cylindrospora]|nr:hypothetical protein ABW19_dt0208028 [Dactylella cylindrospora]
MPADIVDIINDLLGATSSNSYLTRETPSDDSGVLFTFAANLTIYVPLSQFLSPVGLEGYEGWYYVLAVESTDGGFFLGNPFFRSAYVFYDFTNGQISIAQSIFNQTETNIKEVGVSGDSVLALGLDQPDETPTPTPTPTPSPSPFPSPTPTPEPSESKSLAGPIGGGVGGGVALIALAVGIWWYVRRRNRQKAAMDSQNYPPPPPVPPMGEHPQGYYNDGSFSPTKPSHPSFISSPVEPQSPISELGGGSTSPWPRTESVAKQGGTSYPTIHERVAELA